MIKFSIPDKVQKCFIHLSPKVSLENEKLNFSKRFLLGEDTPLLDDEKGAELNQSFLFTNIMGMLSYQRLK